MTSVVESPRMYYANDIAENITFLPFA